MKTLKNYIHPLAYTFIFLLGAAAGQFTQITISSAEYRDYKLNEWSKGNTERARLAEVFKRECITGSRVSEGDVPEPVITIQECSEMTGTQDVVAMLEANQAIKTIAWPLSLIN
ncbi:hypothetical protein [Methylophaga nitratireducenticrescens]|uniref:hypothetical protein n=1 Tax=Methylophaga nitratireducenticrescens TaxID=754476 RepID=UPI000CDC0388|nr:hypothetical protein [Methylophaga nitratireducenticrescens]AUZ86170.1 hypothetical protein CDW43_16070 [Methylophaga nitratireducenticrescens]